MHRAPVAIEEAAATYRGTECATDPTAEALRADRLEAAAIIAQGFPDLRDGANLALAGR
ncbi:hypothetical protein RM844_20215 [Streptomyces sp. DSM 44915]|uniref:Uncharacterized protein n=1 Tax=Streptomyces chisholmiae TaxID=3075540 RepID=A0ABU2JWL0_9ACTN|nr:hypothetical protein [Streptomyces sp. DSM 44915]MDT0268613.1 hypothetical protein [Streptomyces sp. DSM 44915]